MSTTGMSATGTRTTGNGHGGQWWRTAVIYQVYPRSFADSDGDGIGDLPGITDRLDHLAELGVDAVWLSPFYASPQADGGYDVADHTDVDPLFGSLEDADALIARAHELGLRVLVDLVPNHVSDEHPWFVDALLSGPGSEERSRFLFRDGRGPGGEQPPTNWRSVFGGSAWERVVEPDGQPAVAQWYLHLFDVKQPDLDWTHPAVREMFEEVLRFWLDRGVDGFRVDVAHGLIKDQAFPDWHADHAGAATAPDGARAPMWDRDEVHAVYRSWRRVLEGYDGERILVAEAWVEPAERLAAYVRHDEMHQAFNFEYLTTAWVAAELRATIERTTTANAAVGAPTTWVLSNHDVVRHPSRLGLAVTGASSDGAVSDEAGRDGIGPGDPQPDQELGLSRARAATLLMLALPGSAYLYQGEELGLPEHTLLEDGDRADPTFARTRGARLGRDGCRVPLPWRADAPGFGFGPTSLTWLPQPESFARCALDVQQDVPGSTYEMYRSALALRRELDLGAGEITWSPEPGRDDVLRFTRTTPTHEVSVITVTGDGLWMLPPGSDVALASRHFLRAADGAGLLEGPVTAWVRIARA